MMRSLRSLRGKPKVDEASSATRGVRPKRRAAAAAWIAMSANCSAVGISVTAVSAIRTTRPLAKIAWMPMGRWLAGGSSTVRTSVSAVA